MKENLKIGFFKWFGGYNRKIGRINNRGVVEYIDSNEELVKIFQFSDDTKKLTEYEYDSLKDKPIISFNENDRKYIYLIENEDSLSILTVDEMKKLFIELTKLIVDYKKDIIFNIKNKIELNSRIYKVCGFIIKNLFNRGEKLDFLYLNENFNFKYIDFGNMLDTKEYEKNLKIFAQKNELIFLYDLFNTRNRPYLWGREEEYQKNILNLIEKKEKYYDLEESIEICKKINSISDSDKNVNIDLEINCNKEIQNLNILENNSINKVQEYINNNWILKNANSIKYFLEYIENYSFKEELENIFIKQIINFAKEKLSQIYSLKELLSYFDGSIIFNNEENNKLYEELRLEIFETNKIFIKLIKDMALSLDKEDEELCHSFKIFERFKRNVELIYNRNYYDNLDLEKNNFNTYKTLTNILKKNIQSVNDCIESKNIVEALNYFIYVIKNKIKEDKYNYSLVINKKNDISFINSIKFTCLFTGIKFEFEKQNSYQNKKLIGIYKKINRANIELKEYENKTELKNKKVKLFISFAIAEQNIYKFPLVEDIFRFQKNINENTYLVNIQVKYGSRYSESVNYNLLENIDTNQIRLLEEREKLILFVKDRIHTAHWKYDNRYKVTLYNKNGIYKEFNEIYCILNNFLESWDQRDTNYLEFYNDESELM